jgi:hypothetical protein
MTATALDTNLVPSPPPELDVKFVLPDTLEGRLTVGSLRTPNSMNLNGEPLRRWKRTS